MDRLSQGCVLGVGQPLLDYLTHVDDDVYVKYQLKKDNAILDKGEHAPLFEELVRQYEVQYEAGGAGLNTIRMIQWILKKPHACAFVGCVGVDDAADILRVECEKVGVRVKFFLADDSISTGKCAVLLQYRFRSMVTHLGASKKLTLEHVRSNDVWPMVERARLMYVTGYMLNCCQDGVKELAKHAHNNGKMFCFNFGASYVLTYLTNYVDDLLPYVDILFCNRDEAKAYAEKHGLKGQSVGTIAQHLASIPQIAGHRNKRIILITQETDPVIVTTSADKIVRRYPVTTVPSNDLVDTNGAGDAFAAGFIADYMTNMLIDTAVNAGLKAARYIVQKSGFTLGPRDQY
ncbi:Adenosine kinase A [Fasciola gigantica]|uniref:Adenosine kinase n=1 Tax=Fasciola gigantica TaxID=46835 RepID=A0A504ZA53_FASGI|nr:Adenosine kinase A [Fasciola gigantica]